MKRVITGLFAATAALYFLTHLSPEDQTEDLVFVEIKSDSSETVISKKEVYDFTCLTDKTQKKEEKTRQEENKEIIPYQSFNINPLADTNILLTTGTEIHIPKNAFINQEAKLIKKPVNIQFREFHSPTSIALAQISMSLGNKSMLLSGGMFQIKGFQSDQSIKINPDAKITVKLASSEKNEKYNYYYLNPETKRWEDKGDLKFDTLTTASKITPQIKWWEFTEDFKNNTGFFRPRGTSFTIAIREHELRNFRKWAKNPKGGSKANFYTLFSKRRAPQNAQFRYLSWHLSEKNKPETIEQFLSLHNAKKEAAHSFWNDLNIVKCEGENYQIHFSMGNKHLVLDAIPDSKNYPGDNRFNARLLKWEEKLLKKDQRELKALYTEAEQNIGFRIANMNQKEIERFVRLNAINKSEIEQLIKNSRFKLPNPKTPYKAEIAINNFGTHNIDAPVDYIVYGAGNVLKSPIWALKGTYNTYAKATRKKYMKKRRTGYPRIKNEPRDNSTIDKITVIQKGFNTSYEFENAKLGKFEYSSHFENLGIVFLSNGKFKVVPPKEFKGYTNQSAFFDFESLEANSVEELKEVITDLGFEI